MTAFQDGSSPTFCTHFFFLYPSTGPAHPHLLDATILIILSNLYRS
jgi:hypothetical protein